MNLSQAIYSGLKTTTGITSLTSNRIYPLVAPQGVVKPYITYQQISNVPEHAMGTDPKIRSARIQVSAWATSYSGVLAVSTQIKTALRDKQGILGSSIFNVQRIFYDDENDFVDVDPESKKITYYRAQDFIVWTTG